MLTWQFRMLHMWNYKCYNSMPKWTNNLSLMIFMLKHFTVMIFSHLVVGYIKRYTQGKVNFCCFEPGLEWLKQFTWALPCSLCRKRWKNTCLQSIVWQPNKVYLVVSGLTSSIFVTTHSEAQGQQTKDNVFFVNLGYPSEYIHVLHCNNHIQRDCKNRQSDCIYIV